jgi:hypothetical protein
MSNSDTIKCPNCDEEIEFTPTTVIHTESPDITLLFNNELNKIFCPDCETHSFFDTPILYRDDNSNYIIYFLPNSFYDTLTHALEQMKTLDDEIFAEVDKDLRPDCRLTTDRNQFIEKIAIQEDSYDDRLMEYIKFQLLKHSEVLDEIRHTLLYDFANSDEENIAFIAFDSDSGEMDYTLNFKVKEYKELETFYLGTPEKEIELNGYYKPYYIHISALFERFK